MITEGILNVFFSFVSILLCFLPDVNLAIDENGFSTLANVFRMVCYFLPMGTVSAILGVILAINGLRISVAVIKTIWDLLPFL